jgi:hypothetical protein
MRGEGVKGTQETHKVRTSIPMTRFPTRTNEKI